MASYIFAEGKSMVRRAKKSASDYARMVESTGGDYKDAYKLVFDNEMKRQKDEFKQVLEVAEELHDMYKAFVHRPAQSYFITIRPDCNQCSLNEFMGKVDTFVKRKCFIHYTLSYEQKGTSDETIGQGFHVHIVAEMRQRSKTEVIRDVMSSWNQWIAEGKIKSNCIQVDVTKNPQTLIDRYLIEYESDDGHKQVTKEYDAKWREMNGIQPLYTTP